MSFNPLFIELVKSPPKKKAGYFTTFNPLFIEGYTLTKFYVEWKYIILSLTNISRTRHTERNS